MNDGEIRDLIGTCIDDAEVTVIRVDAMPWGMLIGVDIEQVSGDARHMFPNTKALTSRPLGVDSAFVDRTLVMMAFEDEGGVRRFAVGRHSMGESNDEGRGPCFYGQLAIPDPGQDAAAGEDVRRRHRNDVASGAIEMLDRLLALVDGLPSEDVAGLTKSVEARRFMRLLAASA